MASAAVAASEATGRALERLVLIQTEALTPQQRALVAALVAQGEPIIDAIDRVTSVPQQAARP